MSPSGQLCGLLAVDLSRHRDHAKPYRLLFTLNSCFKGVCLVLVAEVFGGSDGSSAAQSFSQTFERTEQNSCGVCVCLCVCVCVCMNECVGSAC